ncbi:Valine--tRNA ligase [Choanephora cucurbitarum]|uniref:valine--tRNA ligase n=1 Tax=Choanephora cucurbitarum TaxID=101091 RepID=A0A1C7NIN7_9FUNG|nr:Valine--tRNA ligase [Choanephora cucurbitarum]
MTDSKKTVVPKPAKEFAPTYIARSVEEGWYEWWSAQGFFRASSADFSSFPKEKEKFTMITPPPNVTGSLHIGHALTFSVQDAIVRWKRMNGYDVQWIPGTDHAGIGTQSVVEKMLMKEYGLTRHDLGREAFIQKVWEWKEKYGNHILHQMRRMGASLDWDREFFTMDKDRYEAVQNAFIRLHKDGLIYRDTRLVNWCCALETVISDIEVDYKDINGRTAISLPGRSKPVEFGVLHNFSYKVVDPDLGGIDELTVSTTRIETMLGDCAVAIHPKDERYKSLHGKFVYHPILEKKIPIVCDGGLVDMEFGTGVVKITPAHDPNDYACGRRHQLPIHSIFDKAGRLNEECGLPELVGCDRFEAREKIIDLLIEKGSYKGRDDNHIMRIAICSRSGDIIEPLLQPQWYIKCKELADISKKQVENDQMAIVPNHFTQDWNRWLDNIQDWCISRQLWWGHEIPAYRIKPFGGVTIGPDSDLWVVGSDKADATTNAIQLLGEKGYSKDTPFELIKDEDVLDTWFSSGLLPLSTLGWKGRHNESIPDRYPIDVMETGFDILFFWVARMAMLSNYFTDQKAPFKTIFLHAMVRDAQGRKMSKSLGNVIDPLHVIEGVGLQDMKDNLLKSNLPEKEISMSTRNLEKEYPNGIPSCGTDSLRFALTQYTQQTRQINLDISNVIQTSHFCNKLWNLFKFGLMRLEQQPKLELDSFSIMKEAVGSSLANRFILSRMADTVSKCNDAFENSRLFEATDALRRFIVEDVCDVYVEFTKASLGKPDLSEAEKNSTLKILHACMDISLRLTHPFMPFVTEELWQHMKSALLESHKKSKAPSIMVEEYPENRMFASMYDKSVEEHFQVVLSIIHASRSIRQGNQISITRELPFTIVCDDTELLSHNGPLKLYVNEIKDFVKASDITFLSEHVCEHNDMNGWTVKVIDSKLKILVPTASIVKSQLEAAAAKGIDIGEVIAKKNALLQKKLKKTILDLDKLHARMSKQDYNNTVPENVKEKDSQRWTMLQLDKDALQNDLNTLNTITLENKQ